MPVRFIFVLLITLLGAASASAADWLTVTSDRVRRVELDRASILPSEAGTRVAWGRIVLSAEQARVYGYRSVQALNRYDCRSHSFLIVKRVYLSDDDKPLREERVDSETPIIVKTGTVDDRFFNEVCRPPSLAELQKTAKKAAERIQEAGTETPRLRHADIELARDDDPADAAQADSKSTASSSAAAKEKAKPESPAAARSSAASKPGAKGKPYLDRSTKPFIDLPPPPAGDTSTSNSKPAASSEARTSAAAESSSESAAPVRAAPPVVTRPAIRPAVSPAMRTTRTRPTPVTKAAEGKTMRVPEQLPPPAAAPATPPQWGYDESSGPDNWASLSPDYALCSKGTRQSPIDLRDGIKVDQEPIQFDYKPSFFRIVDNGHTIQVTPGEGLHITVMGRSYQLSELQFHHPAEEHIDGKGFDMSLHLVHKDNDGRIAIVAVLLQVGSANTAVQTLWNNLPLEANDAYTPSEPLQISDLLPQDRRYFSYLGSLTTPPCTEGVLWLVLKQPVQISADQLAIFTRFYPNNARPIQPTGNRIIKESR